MYRALFWTSKNVLFLFLGFFFYVQVDCIGNESVLRNGLICRLPIEWQSWRLSWRRAISVTYDVKAATAGYSSNSSILKTAHCSLVEVGEKIYTSGQTHSSEKSTGKTSEILWMSAFLVLTPSTSGKSLIANVNDSTNVSLNISEWFSHKRNK